MRNLVLTSFLSVITITSFAQLVPRQVDATTENGHEYVDLGLPSGIRWATVNVGADNESAYGDYYAWGETLSKNDYSWGTNKFANGSYRNLTKYCNNSTCGYNGFVDNKMVLDPGDDAASVNWGGSWRIPSDDEWTELREKCTWKWERNHNKSGVCGYKVVGPNGNSIFLPSAGRCDYKNKLDEGKWGNYWASSIRAENPCYAWGVYFHKKGVFKSFNFTRIGGRSVRAVCPK